MKNIIARGFIACLIGLYPILSLAQTHMGDSLELVTLHENNCNVGCLLDWDFSQPVTTWEGVAVENGRVTWLALNNYGLSGELPDFNLSGLIVLTISGNPFGKLEGEIPNFSGMPSLISLDLNGHNLNGQIPSFDNLPNLESFFLTYNNLTGSIPSFSNLPNLERIDLSGNQLSGCFSEELVPLCQIDCTFWDNPNLPGGGNFSAFCDFGFGTCDPSGYVNPSDSMELVRFYNDACLECPLEWDFTQPVSTWQGIVVEEEVVVLIDLYEAGLNGILYNLYLPALKHLSLGGNSLTDSIPNLVLPALEFLNLYRNEFEGKIPNFDLPNLVVLDIGANNLIGPIPDFDLPNLVELSLYNNKFDTPITNFNLPNLEDLSLRKSGFVGSIPDFNLPKLVYLDISNNNLSGEIPNFSGLPNLNHLSVSINDLSGEIPDFNQLSKLTRLYAYSNDLSGAIPNFSNIPQLQTFLANSNDFDGTIPSFSFSPNLSHINLSSNNLSGAIPSIPQAYILEVYNNFFSFREIYDYYINNNTYDFSYSFQRYGENQYKVVEQGEDVSLTLSPPIQYDNINNVSYQWRKNKFPLVGIEDSLLNIFDVKIDDIGVYTLHMRDTTRIPDLEIISEPIYVVVPGYDLTGEPVVYNELIMEFDDWEDKTRYEEEYLFPNAGVLTDSCSCNRLLYLWQFPNDTSALSILIDINTKTENQDGKTDVDGGLNNIIDVGALTSGTGWTWTGEYTDNYPHPVTIYQLDSGSEITNSPHLLEEAPVDACYGIPQSSGYNYADTLSTISGDFGDKLGHGTYGFGSITEGLSVHMNVSVIPLKVFNENGQGTLFNFICALYHAIDHDADIINVSAGYSGQPSEILEKAIATAYEKGIFIVTATGNDGVNIDETPQYPAFYAAPDTVIYYEDNVPIDTIITHYDNVISVASINPQDELSGFSNFGQQAAILSAYGEDMGGFDHTGKRVSSSGSSVSTYYVTKQLAAEIARDTSRDYRQIWFDFENSSLRDCPATSGLTKTGKCLDITLDSACCGASGETIMQFSVFPNPTNDELTVELELTEEDDSGKISLYNVNGKQLLEQTKGFSVKERFGLNFSAFPAGVYFLKLEVGGFPLIHKIVKY